ncbi:MAG TPA: DUF2252 domain-containing protein [Ornithinibacter sp.]|nr:DUF2252 domain-containing protein [Ornithinibacter sp.]
MTEQLTPAERRAKGKAARAQAPLESNADIGPDTGRDPVGLIVGQAATRVPELVPIRHGRMLASPFTFYRGAALPMAADLARVPSSGLRVQLCGDAHLSNFGVFGAPDRRLVFDLNDFDETLPGPFEWDVKRFAASLAVAGRDVGLSAKDRKTLVTAGVGAYRTGMAGFTEKKLLEVWYARLDIESVLDQLGSKVSVEQVTRTRKAMAKARTRDSMQVLKKLTTVVDGHRRFVSTPPLVVPIEELNDRVSADEIMARMATILRQYRRTLSADRQHLVEQFQLVGVARKVVGVGSVGTRAWVLLLEADGGREPLFLQAKEAQRSVLADYCGASRYRNEGQRVVAGQHLMQAASDIFLGWQHIDSGLDGQSRDFYVRQLRDWKYSAEIETMVLSGLVQYAQLCGWTLARAHARSGDRFAIAGYLGKSDKFDRALAAYAEAYADRNEADHAALSAAVTDGRIEAVTGI